MPADTLDLPTGQFKSIKEAFAAQPGPLKSGNGPDPEPKPTTPESQKEVTRSPVSEPGKAAPAPAPQAEPDADIISGKRSPKSEDFKRVKTAADEQRKAREETESKLADIQKRLDEAEKKAASRPTEANQDKLLAIQQERDKYKQLFDEIAVEWSPEFNAKYQSQMESAIAGVKGIVAPEVASKLVELLQLPDNDAKRRAMLEITEELDEFQKGEIFAANREVRKVMGARQAELKNASEKLNTIATERKAKQESYLKDREETFTQTMARLQDKEKGLPVFQLKDGDAEQNKSVQEMMTVAKAIYSGQLESDSERAEAAAWAASAPSFLRELKATREELTKRDAIIAKLQSGNPGVQGGSGGESGGGTPKSFVEIMQSEVGKQRR